MVVKEKQALKAVHRLLTQGRQLFGEGMSSKNSFTYFDELEGLMGYNIAWQDDKCDRFESELKKCAWPQTRHPSLKNLSDSKYPSRC
jgi:hypothetical protein